MAAAFTFWRGDPWLCGEEQRKPVFVPPAWRVVEVDTGAQLTHSASQGLGVLLPGGGTALGCLGADREAGGEVSWGEWGGNVQSGVAWEGMA